jgi:putative ABC transport system ATP-binding protein
MEYIIQSKNLSKSYNSEGKSLAVLNNINFEVVKGETLSIVGPSGSGKTTLLGLCAGLDSPSSGDILINGVSMIGLSEDDRAELRSKEIGFIFQNFQLIPTLTAIENIMIPMELKEMKDIRKKALDLLDRVGLSDRKNHYPSQLSGGEQQRISLARAFGNQPSILFADEPTGNLDQDTAQQIESLLFALNKAQGTTLVIVTHNAELAQKTNRIITIRGGKLISDVKNNRNNA